MASAGVVNIWTPIRPQAGQLFHADLQAKPKLGVVAEFIDKVLEADRLAPRKQRHTARRLYRRILTEFPDATVAESTVRNYVRERKRQLGLIRRETFVPQSYGWAQEAQVDWYEAWVDLGCERTRIQVFAMRSMASSAKRARNSGALGSPSCVIVLQSRV